MKKAHKKFVVNGKNALGHIHMEPFQTATLDRNFADKLLKENSTGKTLRNMQMWATKHEVCVDGDLYVLSVSDDKRRLTIKIGSDL